MGGGEVLERGQNKDVWIGGIGTNRSPGETAGNNFIAQI